MSSFRIRKAAADELTHGAADDEQPGGVEARCVEAQKHGAVQARRGTDTFALSYVSCMFYVLCASSKLSISKNSENDGCHVRFGRVLTPVKVPGFDRRLRRAMVRMNPQLNELMEQRPEPLGKACSASPIRFW